MRKHQFLAAMLFNLFTLFHLEAQNDPMAKDVKVKITFSNVYQDERRNAEVDFVFADAKGDIYMIKSSKGGYLTKNKDYIEKYDPNLKQIFEKELSVDNTSGKPLDLVNAFSLKGQPYVFGLYHNVSKEMRYLFAMKLDANDKLSTPEKIAEVATTRDLGRFFIRVSKDSSKIAIITKLPTDKKQQVLPINFTVFDNNLKEIWKGSTSFPTDKTWDLLNGTSYTTVIDNFSVDNTGRLMTLIEVPREKEVKKKDDSEKLYNVFVFEKGLKEPKRLVIDLDKKTIFSFKLLETTKRDEMIGVGTYSENKKLGFMSENDGTNGSFFFKLDLISGKIVKKSINPFSKSIFEFMKIDEKDQMKGKGIDNVFLLDYFVTKNDNVLLSLEQKFTVVREYKNVPSGTTFNPTTNTTTQRTTSSSSTIYNSGTMFNVKYDKEGKIVYQNYIPKSLDGLRNLGMYHILAPLAEHQAVIFNDHRKNINKKLTTYRDLNAADPSNQNTVARLVTVDEAGKRKSSVLFSAKDEDFVLQPNVRLSYAPGVVITMGLNGKYFKLIRIEY